jgi:ribose/xylose/arabinose/galactoside ABC-type transport system permease subunit
VNLKKIFRDYTVLIILVVISVGFGIAAPRFFQPRNILNVIQQSAVLGIAAIGVTLTILSAGIDLSVGSVLGFCGALAAGLIVRTGLPVPIAILATMTTGFLIGAFNGLLVVKGGLAPFVVTLAMLAMARGFTLIYTGGSPISGMPESFTFLGRGSLGPIPMPVIIFLVVALLSSLFLRHVRTGLHIYAIGGSEETARLAGIKVGRTKILVYALSGLTASIAGIVLAARLFSAQPQSGSGLELNAIAATVLGGTSLMGGYGGTAGTVAGALIMGVISNGLNLIGVAAYIQRVLTGAVFIVAVMIDMWTKSEKFRT